MADGKATAAEPDFVDVLIVGSGPVGAAFARTISDLDPALTILMVEAGPQISTPPGRHVKTIRDSSELAAAQVASQGPDDHRHGPGSGTSRSSETAAVVARPGTFLVGGPAFPGEDGMPAAAMSTNVGGMGAHWTCASPAPGEGERIPFIDRPVFDEAFAQASRLLHVTQHGFDGVPLGDDVRAILAAQLDAGRAPERRVQPMPLALEVDESGDRYWTGPDVILGPLDTGSKPGFELRPGTLALSIVHDDGTATGVRLRDVESAVEFTVNARAVVVAGDALRTPRLLHASGIRPRALGHYLNDHAQVIGVVQLDDRFIPAGDRPERASAGRVDGMSGVSWIPYDRDTFPFHGQIVQMDASPVPIEGVDEPWPGSIVGVGLFCAKDIRFEDHLEFDDGAPDYQGQAGIAIHYALTEVDHGRIDAAIAEVARLASALGTPVGGREPIVMPAGSSMHYMGTTRMGPVDDGTSVCDSDSRLWGMSNVYVGGNGVIPTPTACNPTATSIALAILSARSIVVQLGAVSASHSNQGR